MTRRPTRIVALFLAVVALALGAIVWDQRQQEASTQAPAGTSTDSTGTGSTGTDSGADPYGGLK